MKRLELIDTYLKLLHVKNYSPATEKSYLHHLNLFLDYIKTTKISNVDSKFLLNYFNEYKLKVYLLEGQNGGKYSTRSIQQNFNNAVKKARIKKKVTVHTLCHSFASHLLDSGTDIRFIQELLVHKHLSTTQIYTHINPVSVKKIQSRDILPRLLLLKRLLITDH